MLVGHCRPSSGTLETLNAEAEKRRREEEVRQAELAQRRWLEEARRQELDRQAGA